MQIKMREDKQKQRKRDELEKTLKGMVMGEVVFLQDLKGNPTELLADNSLPTYFTLQYSDITLPDKYTRCLLEGIIANGPLPGSIVVTECGTLINRLSVLLGLSSLMQTLLMLLNKVENSPKLALGKQNKVSVKSMLDISSDIPDLIVECISLDNGTIRTSAISYLSRNGWKVLPVTTDAKGWLEGALVSPRGNKYHFDL